MVSINTTKYKTAEVDGELVRLRLLEPMERHYYRMDEYIYSGGGEFWLILNSDGREKHGLN